MELSILIARIASVIYLSASLGGFCSTDFYRSISDDMYKNSALAFTTGFTAVILGFLIVSYHNTWAMNWTILITLMGWFALIKGVILIAFPKFLQRLSMTLYGRDPKVFPYVSLLVGLLFGYVGFVRGGI